MELYWFTTYVLYRDRVPFGFLWLILSTKKSHSHHSLLSILWWWICEVYIISKIRIDLTSDKDTRPTLHHSVKYKWMMKMVIRLAIYPVYACRKFGSELLIDLCKLLTVFPSTTTQDIYSHIPWISLDSISPIYAISDTFAYFRSLELNANAEGLQSVLSEQLGKSEFWIMWSNPQNTSSTCILNRSLIID